MAPLEGEVMKGKSAPWVRETCTRKPCSVTPDSAGNTSDSAAQGIANTGAACWPDSAQTSGFAANTTGCYSAELAISNRGVQARDSAANSCDFGCEAAVVDSDCSDCSEESETARTEAKWSADAPDYSNNSAPSDAVSVDSENSRRAWDWSYTRPAAAGFARTARDSDRSPAATASHPVAYRAACHPDSKLARSTEKLPAHSPVGDFGSVRRFPRSWSGWIETCCLDTSFGRLPSDRQTVESNRRDSPTSLVTGSLRPSARRD